MREETALRAADRPRLHCWVHLLTTWDIICLRAPLSWTGSKLTPPQTQKSWLSSTCRTLWILWGKVDWYQKERSWIVSWSIHIFRRLKQEESNWWRMRQYSRMSFCCDRLKSATYPECAWTFPAGTIPWWGRWVDLHKSCWLAFPTNPLWSG